MEDWKRQEKELARKHGGKRTPGSGNKAIKGDVLSSMFFIEAKHRNSENSKGNYIDLMAEWLLKLIRESNTDPKHRIPLLNIDIGNYVRYSLIPIFDWLEISLDSNTAIVNNKTINSSAKQIRLMYNVDYSYNIIQFSFVEFGEECDTGQWIVIPDEDLYRELKLKKLISSTIESVEEPEDNLGSLDSIFARGNNSNNSNNGNDGGNSLCNSKKKESKIKKIQEKRKSFLQEQKQHLRNIKRSMKKSSPNWTHLED